jgi:hypothetical protein
MKPAFKKFSTEELNYLKECLPEYIIANNEGSIKKGERVSGLLGRFSLTSNHILDIH